MTLSVVIPLLLREGAKYCDQHVCSLLLVLYCLNVHGINVVETTLVTYVCLSVCVYVCLYVRLHASFKNRTCPNFTKVFCTCYKPTCGRGSVLLRWLYFRFCGWRYIFTIIMRHICKEVVITVVEFGCLNCARGRSLLSVTSLFITL